MGYKVNNTFMDAEAEFKEKMESMGFSFEINLDENEEEKDEEKEEE